MDKVSGEAVDETSGEDPEQASGITMAEAYRKDMDKVSGKATV